MRTLLAVAVVALSAAAAPGQFSPDKPVLALEAGGHTAPIGAAAFSPDGRRLYTGSLDKTVRVWDVHTGDCVAVWRMPVANGHSGEVLALALSPDGRTLAVGVFGYRHAAVGPFDTPIYLIDTAAGEIVRALKGHTSFVMGLSFSADGARLASAANDHTVRVWNATTGAEVGKLVMPAAANAVALSPDGKRLVATAPLRANNTPTSDAAVLWTIASGARTLLHAPHEALVSRVAWSADGQRVVTGSSDENFVVLWDAAGKFVRKLHFPEKYHYQCHSVAFTPDGTGVVFAVQDGWRYYAGLLDAAGGGGRVRYAAIDPADRQPWSNPHNGDMPVGKAVVSPDGRFAAVIDDRHHRTALFHLRPKEDNGKLRTFTPLQLFGGVGRQPAAVAWVRGKDEQAARTIVWRTAVLGQKRHEEPWAKLDPKTPFYEWAFRLTDLRPAALPTADDPNKTFVRFRQRNDAGVVLNNGGKDAELVVGGKKVEVPVHGPEWVVPMATTFWGPDRLAIGKHHDIWTVDVSNPAKPGEPHKLMGLNGNVLSAAPSPDTGKYLLASVDDQIIRVFSHDRGLPVVSLFAVPPPAGRRTADWVAWTPEGYYAASPGGEGLMGFHLNNPPDEKTGTPRLGTFHPAARFRDSLYRPDVVARVLAEGSVAAAVKAADAARGVKAAATAPAVTTPTAAPAEASVAEKVLPPRVLLTSPTEPAVESADGTLAVEAIARPAGEQPVTGLQLIVDGRPYSDVKGGFKPAAGGRPAAGGWELKLPPGTYKVSVLGRTAASAGTSAEVTVTVPTPAALAAQKNALLPALHVLAIGINDYPDGGGLQKLRCAVNDATGLVDALRKGSGGVFKAVVPTVLTDTAATRDGIRAAFDNLKGPAGPGAGDVTVVFYAGHGERDAAGRFHLMPVNANPKDVAGTGIPRNELTARLAAVRGRVLLFLDACHAGAAIDPDDLLRTLTADDCAVAVYCATEKDAPAGEAPPHGYFTQALIDGLNGKAQTNADGMVCLPQLSAYVSLRVPELSNAAQYPYMITPPGGRGRFLFPIARPSAGGG